MAIPFLPIALGLAAAGSVLQGFQTANVLKGQKAQYKAQAQAVETEEAQTSADRMHRLRQVLAANVASAAGLGIDPGSASVLAVNEDAARRTGRAIGYDRTAARFQSDSLRGAARALKPTTAVVTGVIGSGSRLLPLLRPGDDG